MNTLTNTTIFVYKGTAFPVVIDNLKLDDILTNSNLMIKKGLENNLSIKQQINIYVEQLDIIENELFKQGPIKTDDDLKNIEKNLNKNTNEINAMWMLNISALIKMKHLKDDNMNGFITIK